MNQFKAALFDLDGTLINTENLILSSAQYASKVMFGVSAPREEFAQFIGIPLAVQLETVARENFEARKEYDGVLAEDVITLRDQLLHNYAIYCADNRDKLIASYDGVADIADYLREKNVPRAVVTSKRRMPALEDIAYFGLDTTFQILVAADDMKEHKPDPAPLLRALELIEEDFSTTLRPQECVYIGDSPFDIQAAKAAGMHSVGVSYGIFTEEVLRSENPDQLFATPQELLGYLRTVLG